MEEYNDELISDEEINTFIRLTQESDRSDNKKRLTISMYNKMRDYHSLSSFILLCLIGEYVSEDGPEKVNLILSDLIKFFDYDNIHSI